jgi:SAM-dependent methyltransferase
MDELLKDLPTGQMRMLHFAPERFFSARFRRCFGGYETADVERSDVDHHVDLQSLTLPDASYDVVYASHVLEHVPDDRAALREIRRILKSGGFAVLPVPIVAERTIEYSEPNPLESMHVRAPGPDYFDRYREFFGRVEIIDSGRFDARYQPFTVELRRDGLTRLPDYVPICHA